jgi:hypothetical protein
MPAKHQSLNVEGSPVRINECGPSEVSALALELGELPPWLTLEVTRDERRDVVRTELVGSRPHGPIAFVGGLEGLLLDPFLETARALATGEIAWVFEGSRGLLLALELPVELEVLVTPSCPFCATAAEAALRFATASTTVKTTIRRADLGALPQGVHALPTVLADGAIVAEGALDEGLLLRQITSYQRSLPARSGVTCVAPSERGQPEPSPGPRPALRGPRATRRPPRSTAA